MEDAPMSDDFQPPEPSQTSAAWVRSVRAMEQGPGRDIVQWQSSPSAYAALESLKRRSEMAAPPPKPRVPLFAPQRRNSSAPSLVTAAANASFGLLPYDKRVAPSKARKMGPPKIVLPTASQNDFPHLGKIARSIMEDQQLLKRKRLEKQQQAKQGEPSCVKLKPKGKEKEKERETKGKGKERERIDLLPIARSCSDSMVDRTNIRPPSPSSPFYEGTTPRQADYRQAAGEDEASMDTDTPPAIGASVRQRPPLDAVDFTFASDDFSHSTPPSRRLAKTRSIVMDDPEDEPHTPLGAPAQLKHPPPIGADTEPSTPQRTLSARSRQAAPSRGIPNPTDTRSLSPEVPLMDEHEDGQNTEDEEDVPPRPPSPQSPTRLQAVRPAPKPKPKPATVAHQHHSQPHQLSRQPSQPRQEPPPPQQSRFPPPSQTPSPTQRAPPPLGMRRYGTVATSFRPSQELPTKRKGFKPPFARGAPAAADTRPAVGEVATSKATTNAPGDAGVGAGRGGVKATDYAARVNLNVTSEPSSSFPARPYSPEVPLDADSSYGELSFDMDALEEVAKQYD